MIKIITNNPSILNMKDEIEVNGPTKLKISLKFLNENEENSKDYILFLMKDMKPWTKVTIQVDYTMF